jgi:hypothetical protein
MSSAPVGATGKDLETEVKRSVSQMSSAPVGATGVK